MRFIRTSPTARRSRPRSTRRAFALTTSSATRTCVSSNFLEIDKYPTITFKSTKIEPAGADLYTLTGDLTIKGTTQPVTLKVVKYGEFNDPNMGHRIGYAAEGQLNRRDFGMKFDVMLDGKFIVSNEIQINIEGELIESKPTE